MMGFLLRKNEVEVQEDLLGVVMEVSHEAFTASLRKALGDDRLVSHPVLPLVWPEHISMSVRPPASLLWAHRSFLLPRLKRLRHAPRGDTERRELC